MGLKKYEIITAGSNKRVRALRSWQVGDRYVNIGDIGGIVYDEKTLSQDGLCWLFSGNFGFPGARIGGDSIVDVGETALSTEGTPSVDILGSSVVAGSKLQFGAEQTEADAVVLTANDFEQGLLTFAAGANWETWKSNSPQYLRSKAPIFMGGASKTFKLEVPGYLAQAYTLTRDGLGVSATAGVTTGPGATLVVPAAQYCLLRLNKTPIANIVPADATTAAITFTGTYETKLSIVDSRVEINPAISTATVFFKPGGSYTMSPGVKYPEYTIRNSKVSINGHATANRSIRLMGQIIGSTAVLDCTTENLTLAGTYSNVKNLTASGVLTTNAGISTYNIIQATDCDNFAVSPTVFPGVEAAQTANIPFIFQGCNVPDGRFYHHAQIANTYKNIDFALASEDLGKSGKNAYILVSSEIEGMYRLYSTTEASFGAVVESYESIRDSGIGDQAIAATYGTTIYKDAYFNGLFELAGTNVFGSKSPSHPIEQVLNVQPRVVQGTFNTILSGQAITGVVPDATRVSIPTRIRLNRHDGVVVHLPAGLEAKFMAVDPNNKIIFASVFVKNEASVPEYARYLFAFIQFRKTGDAPITPEDLAGVTMTVYNGCKVSKSSSTSIYMRGNVRVEDNAMLYDAKINGSGYFGGNAVMSGMDVNGYAYMKDNTLCTKTSETVQTFASLVMEGNAAYNSIAPLALSGLNVFMYDNSKVLGELRSASSVLIMRDNATITAKGNLSGACVGVITIKDNAVINTSISTIGDITLCGGYVSTPNKTWTGKRVIDSQDAPTYDNNVKTQYDF
jgi:hypothetical protein